MISMMVSLGAIAIMGADVLLASPRVGDVYELAMVRDSIEQGSNGSSSSTHDKDTITERVISVRPDGLEVEYDLPRDATTQDRSASWQFPLRIYKPQDGPAKLLNEAELKTRLDLWLKAGEMTREACGHWIFTWNAFRIECDPQSAIKTVEAFETAPPNLREGAPYHEEGVLSPAPLKRRASGAHGANFTAELKIDPDAVREAQANTDVAVGEIMGKPIAFEDALRAQAKTAVSGTIVVSFDLDPTGKHRKTVVTQIDFKSADGSVKSRTATQTIDRTLISSANR